MRLISGFSSTSQDDYPLNITTILRHAVRNFGGQEIVSRTMDHIFRYTYKDAYERILRLANVLENIGIVPGNRLCDRIRCDRTVDDGLGARRTGRVRLGISTE